MMRALLILWLVCAAVPAHAAFIGAAISAIGAFVGGLSATAVGIIGFVARFALTALVSAYQRRRMKRKMADQQSGIKTNYVTSGGTTPLSIVVGRYATAGHMLPPASHPQTSSPPNAYLTYVIALSDLPRAALSGRVVINDQWATLNDTLTVGLETFGKPVLGPFADKIWFRFLDGTQTAADPFLMARLADHPERPWTADMIGRGICFVIVTCLRDAAVFPGEPRFIFELLGIPLYDPRKDSTVGGVGLQRWGNAATYTFTENPKVIEYNLLRNITVDGYGTYGGGASAADLPLSNWFAAMNECDLLVDNGAGGTVAQWRFGFEISLADPPKQIINEINRSCGGETVEIGGVYKTRVGGIGLPVFFFSDGDVLVSKPQEMDPFGGLDTSGNAFSASFPDPALLWDSRESPPLTNAPWELEDGTIEFDEGLGAFARRPRRLMRSVSFPGVSDVFQVQRLLAAYAREGRKFVSHVLTLPESALALEPLDAVSWTSVRNGYTSKVFDVVMTANAGLSLTPRLGLLEADPADFTPPPFVPLPAPNARSATPAGVNVVGFVAQPFAIADAAGNGRRPGLRLVWTGPAMADTRGIRWEVRVAATGQMAAQGTASDPRAGEVIVGGLLAGVAYEARAIAITDRSAFWTGWLPVTVPNVLLGRDDITPNTVVRSLGSTDFVALGAAVILAPGGGFSGILSVSVVDASGPSGGQQAFGAIRCELTAALPRWITLRVRLVWPGFKADVVQEILIRPGILVEVGVSGAAETLGGITSIELAAQPMDLMAGESLSISHARVRCYSFFR